MAVSIIEERDEFTVSLKRAHFLKPSSISEPHPQPPPLLPPNPKINKNSLKVSFKGCLHPQKSWNDWVTHMHSIHQTLWKEVGIHDAILNSTYKVGVNDDLVLALAEKWCCDTNSFVFPWGEVSITLEDMIFLGGYSVLGDSVFSPLENKEEIEVFEQLERVRKDFNLSRAKKAPHGPWLSKFMYSGSPIEHEAFLALWLSRFVFPKASDSVTKLVLPVAVRLARGTKIAIAPAVLASIYRDLRLIKSKFSESGKCKAASVVVWSPMQLVQVWVFERFSLNQFKPNDIENGEPRFARWCDKDVKMNYVREVRELASEDFCWCPYSMWPCKFYNLTDGWVLVDSGLHEELESFARSVRVSELVGVDCGCIEQYLPHRVAMQFGLAQDIPGPVARANESAETAWVDYRRPIGDVGLYFPSRFFEPCVTTRYVNWWNNLSGDEDTAKRGSSSSMLPDPELEKSDDIPPVPPGFPPRGPIVEVSSSSDEHGKGTSDRSELVSEECRGVEEDVDPPKTAAEVIVPPSFPQTTGGSNQPSVQSSASSIPNDRSFEMGNVVKNKVSKELSRDISEPEKEAGPLREEEKSESYKLIELEILESGFDYRLSRLENIVARLKAIKAAKRRRLD